MSSIIQLLDSAARPYLSDAQLERRAPAAFAERAFTNTSPHYLFISTRELLGALREVGIHPTDARQRWSRGDRLGYARHMIRFRAADSLTVVDCSPEIILINSHDSTGAYELRAGLYRSVCCNGVIVSLADLGVVRVPHRGNLIANVVEAAQHVADRLNGIGPIIERMARTALDAHARQAFAERALRLRFRDCEHVPFAAHRLLEARRDADAEETLWCVYNRVQENIIRGGIEGKSATGRKVASRRITALKEDVRLNVALWQEAMALIKA